MLDIGSPVTVKIHDITSSGEGVGRIVDDGDSKDMIVFVPHTIPGEVCRAEITEVKKGHLKGKILEIPEVHPARINPPCPYFGACPGCSLQFIEYSAQLSIKVNRIKRIFEHGISAGIDSFPAIQSPQPYGYRTHMTIGVDLTRSIPAIGFTDPSTRRIIDIPECLLMPDWSRGEFKKLRTSIAKNKPSLPGKFKLRIFFDHPGKIMYVVNPRGSQSRDRRIPKGIDPILGQFPRPVMIDRTIAGVNVKFHPSSFVQANEFLMERLYQTAVEKIDPDQNGTFIDLYAGRGFFSLYLTKPGRDVVALEYDRLACDNIRKMSSRVAIVQGKAEKQIHGVLQQYKPRVVVANPPRSGINRIIVDAINSCESVKQVVMISCDASTCVRDCKILMGGNFVIGTPTIVDMYPQTAHAEIVVDMGRV